MKLPFLLIIAFVCISVQAQGQGNDDARIRKIVQEQESAWNAGSAKRYCVRFQGDASLTSITGAVYSGRQEVEARMAEIFATVFKGTRISTKVQSIHFVRNDVAIVDIDTEMIGYKGLPPGVRAPADGKLRTRLQQVMVKEPSPRGDSDWSVVALHNVDVKTP
jgi:uncharacterized protein (TIGR02246 family)